MHFLPDLTLVLCNWRVIVEPSPALGKSCSMAHNVTCSPSITDREVVLKPTLVAMDKTNKQSQVAAVLFVTIAVIILSNCWIFG